MFVLEGEWDAANQSKIAILESKNLMQNLHFNVNFYIRLQFTEVKASPSP